MCVFVFPAFFVFFRGGSNMVASRAKVDGKWQASFQECLRYREAGLRPSGFPNLPFHLSPPLLSPFSILSPLVPLFTPFPSSLLSFLLFSTIFQQFSFTFLHFPLFLPFLVKETRLHAMCSTRHRILRRTRHVVKEDFACF